MVSSVGNSGEKGGGITEYPAGYDEVIGVGSVNEKMERSVFSNTGKSVELVAPGENIPVTSYWGLQGSGSGTSYAAALWSENPDRSAQEIRVLLDRSATRMGDEEEYGYGLVSYENASQHEELADLGKDAESSEEENIEKEGNSLSENKIPEREHDTSRENKNPEDITRGYEIPASLKASWNIEGHTNLISSLASGLMNTANIDAVRDAATYVDKSSTLSGYDILHARKSTNYISAAKRLYHAALDWNDESDYSILYEEAERYENIFLAAKALCGDEVFNENAFKKNIVFDDIETAVKSEKGLTTSALGTKFFKSEYKNKANLYFTDSVTFMAKRYSVATKVATSYLLNYYCEKIF